MLHKFSIFLAAGLILSFTFLPEVYAKSEKSKFKTVYPAGFLEAKKSAVKAFKAKDYSQANNDFASAWHIVEGKNEFVDLQVETLLSWAQVYETRKQYDNARIKLESAVAITRKISGQSSGKLPPLLDRLAKVTPGLEQQAKILTESLSIRESLVGPKDLSLLLALQRVHTLFVGTARGLPYNLRIVAMRKKLATYKHNSNNVNILGYLAIEYLASGKPAEAEPHAKEACELADGFNGKTSDEHVWAKFVLGTTYNLEGKKEDAEKAFADALETARSMELSSQQELGELTRGLGVLFEYKQYAPAASLCNILLTRSRKIPEAPEKNILDLELQAIIANSKNGDMAKTRDVFAQYKADVDKFERIEKEKERRLQSAKTYL